MGLSVRLGCLHSSDMTHLVAVVERLLRYVLASSDRIMRLSWLTAIGVAAYLVVTTTNGR